MNMGLFKRKQYHVDEAGNVVSGAEPGARDARELEREYRKEHPTSGDIRRQKRAEERKLVREEFEKARIQARVVRARQEGKRAGGTNPLDRLAGFSFGNYRIRDNYNPFGSMFDTGLGYKRPSVKKPASKTRYKVIGGKAYPVAGTGKKKTVRKKRSTGMGGFDIMDNYGFMK